MILLIDNYDSFTYNLFQYIRELEEEVIVRRNDAITVEEIQNLSPDAIIISPGPGKPNQAGISVDVVKHFYQTIPILGICLGHQVIGAAFGAQIKRAKDVKHGKSSLIRHNGTGLFQYLPQPVEVMRYHSLVIDPASLPPNMNKLAVAMDDDALMAIKHQNYPVYGLQFHPESIGTLEGKRMIRQFTNLIRKEHNHERIITQAN